MVSDDGSQPEHISYLQSIQARLPFRLITTPKNKGLANNINKGQDAITTPYTLYVQEDFDPMPVFPEHFADGADMLRNRKDIDMVRFYAYFKYPYLKPLGKGFAEMLFALWRPGYKKFYAYSDHPHLRRSDFLQKFGRYKEGIKSDKAEYLMMMSFLRNKGKSIQYENIHELFDHRNSSDEPSTVKRDFWGQSKGMLVTGIRHLYRHLKFNADYLFGKS